MEPWLEEENTLPHCLESVRRDDLEIILLGTGSSQPSKCRNVTSIFINLFTRGGLLLDCGEGTLGQLKRRYGIERADEAVRNLTCIWMSHIHADPHTGLARILALRRNLLKNVSNEPMLVVGPRQFKRYLDAYQRLEDLDMQFIDCWSTSKDSWVMFDMDDESNIVSSPANSTLFARDSRMQIFWKRPRSPAAIGQALPALKSLKNVLTAAGLDTLISFPVVHCPQAFGLALEVAERTNCAGKLSTRVIPGLAPNS